MTVPIKGGRPKQYPALKCYPVSFSLEKWLVDWLKNFDNKSELVTEALVKHYNLEEVKDAVLSNITGEEDGRIGKGKD